VWCHFGDDARLYWQPTIACVMSWRILPDLPGKCRFEADPEMELVPAA